MVAVGSAAYVATVCASVLAFGSHAATPSIPPQAEATPSVPPPPQPAPNATATSQQPASVTQPPPPVHEQPPPAYQQPALGKGYLQPPGKRYPRPAPRSPTEASRAITLLYVGVAAHAEGDTGGMLPVGPGFMVGALLGKRLNPTSSLNGEFRFEISRRQVDPESFTEGAGVPEIEAAFSPLFHRPRPKGELVIGPKLGVYADGESHRTTFGISFGGNAGMFFRVTPTMSLGGIISYTIRVSDYPSEHVFGFHLGALL